MAHRAAFSIAVKDEEAARECIVENTILRQIMHHCVEDTGGLFVNTPWDPPDHADLFYTACQRAGIPVEEISIAEALRREPLLNPDIRRCLWYPTAAWKPGKPAAPWSIRRPSWEPRR
jgi:glycerol-3-phosphate dehydrogenase